MSSDVDILRRLHRILRQQADLRGQLERGPRLIKAAKANLDLAQQALAKHREEIKQLRMEADRKQLQLRSREQKIFELEGKMNMAKKNVEYQALKEQIAADSQANSVLSDEILEVLEATDGKVSETPQLEERLQLMDAELKKTEKSVGERRAVLEVDLTRVSQELLEVESQLQGELKGTYRRLVESRGEDGLAQLEDKSCGSCNTVLSPRTLDRLKMNEPMLCTSCGCLLYPGERSRSGT